MPSDLIINPYARITVIEKNKQISGLEIEVPIPNRSQEFFKIEIDSNPELVEYIIDLTKCGFGQFNPQDLTDDERDFLLVKGFLVSSEFAPVKPLFHFFLDEIEIEPSFPLKSTENLVVNPSYRLELPDLSKFQHLLNDNFFSPEFPIAWIKLPVTEIEIGYWLRDEFIDVAKKLVLNQRPTFEIEKSILRKLIRAGILINVEDRIKNEVEINQNLETARQNFAAKKYVVLSEILPPHYMSAMRRFFRAYIKNGFMPFKDCGVINRFYQHNLPLACFFHRNLTKLMSIIVGGEVKPSYVFAASYIDEADLLPHIDREQCEYSISFQVDYQAEITGEVSPWDLYLSPLELADIQDSAIFRWENYRADNPNHKKSEKIRLNSGDGLFYKGRELVHYRHPLPKGHSSTSIFFHYVAKDFAGKLD